MDGSLNAEKIAAIEIYHCALLAMCSVQQMKIVLLTNCWQMIAYLCSVSVYSLRVNNCRHLPQFNH